MYKVHPNQISAWKKQLLTNAPELFPSGKKQQPAPVSTASLKLPGSTCLDPYWYLKYLLENLPEAITADEFKALMPQNVDKRLLAALALNNTIIVPSNRWVIKRLHILDEEH